MRAALGIVGWLGSFGSGLVIGILLWAYHVRHGSAGQLSIVSSVPYVDALMLLQVGRATTTTGVEDHELCRGRSAMNSVTDISHSRVSIPSVVGRLPTMLIATWPPPPSSPSVCDLSSR